MLSGYKTIIAAALVTILGFLETFDVTQVLELLPEQYRALALSFVGVLMAALRLVTKTPVGK